jgi:polyhydroxyalkanoate synthase
MRAWAGFMHESHVNALDTHTAGKGYISKEELQQLFALVRSNDLIWSSFVDHYLLDREAPASDLLFWFEDGSHIPEAFLSSYNRKLLLDNHLSDPGKVELLGEKLDLGKIKTPTMVIGLRDDHVSAWDAVYQGTSYFGGQVEFLLGGSGHNAGVINPPSANKHGYWTNSKLADTADEWLAGATRNEGSWWPYWSNWLKGKKGNNNVPARALGSKDYPVIEDAPGRFVLEGNN